jgi:hypothetical protein
MTKKIALIGGAIVFLFTITGCNQVSDQAQIIKSQTDQKIGEIQNQYETTKKQVIDTKAQIDQKVDQAKTAADAVGKLVQ